MKTTFELKLSSDSNISVTTNLFFSTEGKKTIKETGEYISHVDYRSGGVPGLVDLEKGVVSLPTYREKVLTKTSALMGTIKTEYKDTNKLQYSLVYGEYITRGTLQEVDIRLVKTYKVTLTILADGKMSLTRDGKLMTDKTPMGQHLYLINELFKLNVRLSDYYLSRSPRIRRTNWEKSVVEFYYNHTYNNVKKSVYRKVYKNDIKDATATLLWHPQASKAVIKKIKDLLNTGDQYLPESLSRIRDSISDIKLQDPQGFNNFSLKLLTMGRDLHRYTAAVYLAAIFPNIISSMVKTNDALLMGDTHYAYELLEEEGQIYPEDFEIKSFRQLHDVLTQRVSDMKAAKSGMVRLPTLNELPVFTKDGYTVKSVNAHDLPPLGDALSICVGMYKKTCWLGTVNIAAVYHSTGKPVACLEWYYGNTGEGYLVQAKLFSNKSVYKDEFIHALILEWCDANGIMAYTPDMGSTYEGADGLLPCRPEPLEERQKLLQADSSNNFW